MNKQGKLVKVSGPLVEACGMQEAKMYDVVKVGDQMLIGEIIRLSGERAYIQVYEETEGLGPGDPVFLTDEPLVVELGPGLLDSIYDGIQRPLERIKQETGDYIGRGLTINSLPREKKWTFKPLVKKGEIVREGDVIGKVKETALIEHKILVPAGINGKIESIKEGSFTIEEEIAKINGQSIKMLSRWPVRNPRPFKERLAPVAPLVTGQRVIDSLFPVAKGGTACIPGPFGSGKTVVLHQIAKWADSQVIVYVGCGERGNEMADVLLEFPKLKDPKTRRPLTERTILIANTSNMPVAAREASIYTGITIGEYYRDMGYDVALMADSTSRWAEALREISGRMEEMPGEEGYPAYLGTRIAAFYERAGRVVNLGTKRVEGNLSVIGAVSPPGGDLTDPVVQQTLRVVKVFWGLDDQLAYQRHFPAINWLSSYSLHLRNIEEYLKREIDEEAPLLREMVIKILQRETEVLEIVRLVGMETISKEDRLLLEIARSIREDFLHQSAFDEKDAYTALPKQYRMLKVILLSYDLFRELLDKGIGLKEILSLPIREKLARIKYIPEENLEKFDQLEQELKKEVKNITTNLSNFTN